MLEKIFHLKENHTDVKTELMAGVTTFMTMAYILSLIHIYMCIRDSFGHAQDQVVPGDACIVHKDIHPAKGVHRFLKERCV